MLHAPSMSETLVIGHRNPDIDAICSAIGYAEFKRRTGLKNAVAARCGDCNDRTDFVLRTFGVPAPRFVADVSPQVRDVMVDRVVAVSPRTSICEAMSVMDQRNIRVLPILDADQRCRGLLSVFKASKFFFPSPNRIFDSRRIVASVQGLARTLGGRVLCGFADESEEDLILMVAAMKPISFSERLRNYAAHRLVVVVGDREEAAALHDVLGGAAGRVPTVAAKANFGNLGAASGLVECVTSLLAMRHGTLFPLLNYETADPDCGILAARRGTPAGDICLSSAVTPQGQAGALVLRGWPATT